MKSKVYFINDITSNNLVEIYKKVGKELKGNVAVKVHSGEKGNQNYLKPEFLKEIIDYVNGTVVECNTAYSGRRNNTKKHKRLIREHGWNKSFNVDILDEEDNDLVKNSNDIGKKHLLERINFRNGLHTIKVANLLGVSSKEYELINIHKM